MDRSSIVVIGAGATGLAAVQALRDGGYDHPIIMIGDEDVPPYERPFLSKELLRGQTTPEQTLLQPATWFRDNDIDLRLDSRATIDTRSRAVLCGDETIPARAILIATGGRPRQPFGPATERILYLRDIHDAQRMSARFAESSHLVVIGAGFIGAEVTASARSLGLEVTVLEALDLPLSHAIGPEVGRIFADIHVENGVRLLLGEGVASIDERAGDVLVHTTKGTEIAGDIVVIGVGLEPAVEIAREAGAAVDNGILVDEYCRTNVPNVVAAGDVANQLHPLYRTRVRVEHFNNALKQGAAAAMTIVGVGTPYAEPHWFWSDQYEYHLQMAGISRGWDEIVTRGSVEERCFVAFYLRKGVLIAAVGINKPKDIRRALGLIRDRVRPAHDLLRDEAVDLRKISKPQSSAGRRTAAR